MKQFFYSILILFSFFIGPQLMAQPTDRMGEVIDQIKNKDQEKMEKVFDREKEPSLFPGILLPGYTEFKQKRNIAGYAYSTLFALSLIHLQDHSVTQRQNYRRYDRNAMFWLASSTYYGIHSQTSLIQGFRFAGFRSEYHKSIAETNEAWLIMGIIYAAAVTDALWFHKESKVKAFLYPSYGGAGAGIVMNF